MQHIARFDRARGDQSGDPAETAVGPDRGLHRQAQRLRFAGPDLDGVEMLGQRRSAVPRHVGRPRGDIVAADAGDGNDRHLAKPERRRKLGERRRMAGEHRLVVAGQVHLGHRQDEIADAEQMAKKGVAAGLGEHPAGRIEQDDGEVGGRGAGHHVARILLVPRAIGDDEAARRRREIAVGNVDRDALLALGGKPVEQQREVGFRTARAVASAVLFERGELVVGELAKVVEQPADQGRLAVVDAAAGDEPQQVHQK